MKTNRISGRASPRRYIAKAAVLAASLGFAISAPAGVTLLTSTAQISPSLLNTFETKPETCALMLAGLGVLAFITRRRRTPFAARPATAKRRANPASADGFVLAGIAAQHLTEKFHAWLDPYSAHSEKAARRSNIMRSGPVKPAHATAI